MQLWWSEVIAQWSDQWSVNWRSCFDSCWDLWFKHQVLSRTSLQVIASVGTMSMTRSAMQSLDRHLWRSRITNKTKLHLYRVFILPIMLYGSECWAINKADWCSGPVVPTKNPGHLLARLSEILTSVALPTSRHFHPSLSHLTFFGHLAQMDENADASQAIFKPPAENWRWPPGRPCTTWMKNIHNDLSSLDLGTYEASNLAQIGLSGDWYLCSVLCCALMVHVTIGLEISA